jgi:hypothetical protein
MAKREAIHLKNMALTTSKELRGPIPRLMILAQSLPLARVKRQILRRRRLKKVPVLKNRKAMARRKTLNQTERGQKRR